MEHLTSKLGQRQHVLVVSGGAVDQWIVIPQSQSDFNDGAAALAAELGLEDWMKMFNDRRAQGYNQSAVTVGRPYMDMREPEVVESNRVLLVRNLYYHHVATANNQLPYVDRLEISHVVDRQLYDLKASAARRTSWPTTPAPRACPPTRRARRRATTRP